ncbi:MULTISPECIES: nucleotidyltransferase domain-containing protein [Pontibacillus]|uniref:Nucleotidyltransferase domain-containing protein n=1 Tax=Pontibacillus chungwhensis TaxID=265426 RepID=A0ABY8V2P7_9BACI|nr:MULTISPECIES: nucleotidyltransferase domain-containing protein [Pontibacillus]MCD5324899.1 nucleotidyltransferase domain-containing protein [Pontibacillus sp. HN14]WIF98860.1 nucleotidyltransferase domain-containing protein [Pontibacillus chungwhensis]
MYPRNYRLLELAKEFVQNELLFSTYAILIGSVARGDADEYSDLNIICFTGRERYLGDQVIFYKGEYIQLQTKSILEFPNKELLAYNPWHYRFLSESIILKDTNAELSKLQNWAKSYFSSIKGERGAIQDVERLIEGRFRYAEEQIGAGRAFGATHAALATFTEAMLLHQFIYENNVSLAHIVTHLRKLDRSAEIMEVLPFAPNSTVTFDEVAEVMTKLRQHLRQTGFEHVAGLSKLEDDLWARKAKRKSEEGDGANMLWHAYNKAFSLLLETSQDKEFEEYYRTLPASLKRSLESIGFISLPPQDIEGLLTYTNYVIDDSKHKLKLEQK